MMKFKQACFLNLLRTHARIMPESCQNYARIMPEPCQTAQLPTALLPKCPIHSIPKPPHYARLPNCPIHPMPTCPTAQSTQLQLAQLPNPPSSNLPHCPRAQLPTCLSSLFKPPPAAHLFSCSYAKDCRGMFLEKTDFTLLSSPI